MIDNFWRPHSVGGRMSGNCHSGEHLDRNYDRYCEMSSGEITSSGRLALPTQPPDISKKRRGRRRMEKQTGERGWGGDRRVGRIDTLLIIMASL